MAHLFTFHTPPACVLLFLLALLVAAGPTAGQTVGGAEAESWALRRNSLVLEGGLGTSVTPASAQLSLSPSVRYYGKPWFSLGLGTNLNLSYSDSSNQITAGFFLPI